jgi:hypothetical protein
LSAAILNARRMALRGGNLRFSSDLPASDATRALQSAPPPHCDEGRPVEVVVRPLLTTRFYPLCPIMTRSCEPFVVIVCC